MATYPYSPLDPTEPSIRLLHIRKGWWAEDIICQLCESCADQEAGVPYKALSYNWGGLQHKPQEDIPRVLVDGHQIGLTENLYSTLRHIRRSDQDVMLWVDAICINQGDPREKGHQVKQMGKIYKGAEEVLIWLGPSDDGIASLLKHISWVDAKATEAQAMGSNEDWTSLCRQFMGEWFSALQGTTQSTPRRALIELLKRPWFNRVWILQEIANARTARILCGPYSCPARAFALMPALMDLPVDYHTQAVLDIMPRLRKKSWWSSDRQLHVLLNKFSESQAFLARDHIYALLGMSEDACDPGTFYPCYEKTDDEVFRDTASFLLFGEILDARSWFPPWELSDLHLPRRTLAGILIRRIQNVQRTPVDVPGMLLCLAGKQLQAEHRQVHEMLSLEQVSIAVGFDTGSERFFFEITGGSVWLPDAIPVGHRVEIRFSGHRPQDIPTVSDPTLPSQVYG